MATHITETATSDPVLCYRSLMGLPSEASAKIVVDYWLNAIRSDDRNILRYSALVTGGRI